MAYVFRGKLCGLICPECPEPLANVTVRLYRSRDAQTVTALAVANPKETFAILTEEQVKEKASALIAETKTDEEGNFTFALGDNEHYNGEAFEIDVYCGTVPRLKPLPQPPTPLQFSITTLQPRWRQRGEQFRGRLGLLPSVSLLVPGARALRRVDNLRAIKNLRVSPDADCGCYR